MRTFAKVGIFMTLIPFTFLILMTCAGEHKRLSLVLTTQEPTQTIASFPESRFSFPTALPVDRVQPWEELDENGYVIPARLGAHDILVV